MKGASAATAGQLPVANGAGDTVFTTPFNTAGQMYINANATATVVAAAADATLGTDSDYARVVAGFAGINLTNVGFSTDSLTISKAGTYTYHLNANMSTVGASKSAIKIRVNTSNQAQKCKVDTGAGVDVGVSLTGLLTLAVGDAVSIYVANTVGNVTVKDLSFSLVRLGVL